MRPLGYDHGRVTFLIHTGWMVGRSYIEQTGDVESDDWAEVLDTERALSALLHADPEAALVVVSQMHGFTNHECDRMFRGMAIGWKARAEEATVFMSDWLSGGDGTGALNALRMRRRAESDARSMRRRETKQRNTQEARVARGDYIRGGL